MSVDLKLITKPEFDDLENHIAAEIPCNWEMFGIQLKVSHDVLQTIKRDRGVMGTKLCFHDLFKEWNRLKCSPFTWSTVLAALCSLTIAEYRVAKDLCCYLQEHK